MKFTTLRNVTLALLFALLADTVYAGSSGPTPAQRENRRDNNDDQEQQGRPTPRGGVQVLPQEHGGVDLNQFRQRPENPQNRNEADADTRNNQVGRPAFPTDGIPAVRPAPPAGPAVGNTNDPADQPNRLNQTNVQPNVRQRQQQLGLEQILGQNRPAQPPQLRDANQPAPPNTPRGPGAGNQRTTPQNLQDRNRTNVAPGANQWQGQQQRILQLPNANQRPVQPPQGGGQFGQGLGNPQNPNEANADTQNNQVGRPAVQPNQRNVQRLPNANQPAAPFPLVTRMNSAPNAIRVYDGQRVTRPSMPLSGHLGYNGGLIFDHQVPSLDPNGVLKLPDQPDVSPKVGGLIGGGASSKVYESSKPGVIKKFVYLGSSETDRNRSKGLNILLEQDTSRAILGDIKQLAPDVPFQVVQRVENLLWVKATDEGNNNKEHWFALSREENISGEVRVTIPGHDQRNNLARVTSAYDRLKNRGPDLRGETTSLTEEEEFTVNFVIRTLNHYGVVWSDHKLTNFDIAPDKTSFTGFKVVFFDLDGFRPVKGADLAERERIARALQVIYDSSPDPLGLVQNLRDFARQNNLKEYVDAFDNTVYGDEQLGCCISTPGANRDRKTYNDYNEKADEVIFNMANTKRANFKP